MDNFFWRKKREDWTIRERELTYTVEALDTSDYLKNLKSSQLDSNYSSIERNIGTLDNNNHNNNVTNNVLLNDLFTQYQNEHAENKSELSELLKEKEFIIQNNQNIVLKLNDDKDQVTSNINTITIILIILIANGCN